MVPDHVLGRPSEKFRKVQVLAVVTFWSFYLFKGNKHGPPKLRALSRFFSNILTPWQTVVVTLLYLYIARNFDSLLDLENPEPLANLYTRSYFRATWACTALDAGFWTAMKIKNKKLRDSCSILFSVYYLIAAGRADEKVRKVRGALTLDHLRVSWNKGSTPYLKFLSTLMRPRLMKYPPRAIRIPRPPGSDYKEPVQGWLYFDGPLSSLKDHKNIVLDIPGGGFVAMDPRTNDDKLFAWAGKTRLPVLSLDYKKAPEYPYPYALNECYDVYKTLVTSRGRCVGLSGENMPQIVVTGDSAGGTLAAGTVLMIIENNSKCDDGANRLPTPEGLILIYPGLDFNIVNWMSEEHVSLFRDRRMRKTNRNMLRQKSQQYAHLAQTPHHSDDEDIDMPPDYFQQKRPARLNESEEQHHQLPATPGNKQVLQAPTRLAMSSMISYFNDRILSPSMMRSMILLYIGPHQKPDFSADYYISPVLAPPALLEMFPKTYFLTGERDPLVDDTVIFAGRLTRAKLAAHERAKEQQGGLAKEFDDRDHVEVVLIPGISHGFLQFVGLFPEGWKHIYRCGKWIDEIFRASDERGQKVMVAAGQGGHRSDLNAEFEASLGVTAIDEGKMNGKKRRHNWSLIESSGDEGLEMRMTTKSSKAEEDAITARKERLLKETMHEASAERAQKGGGRKLTRKKSLVSLGSEDDILGRRMQGLTSGLSGTGDGVGEEKH